MNWSVWRYCISRSSVTSVSCISVRQTTTSCVQQNAEPPCFAATSGGRVSATKQKASRRHITRLIKPIFNNYVADQLRGKTSCHHVLTATRQPTIQKHENLSSDHVAYEHSATAEAEYGWMTVESPVCKIYPQGPAYADEQEAKRGGAVK
jgi:hypothetical protein